MNIFNELCLICTNKNCQKESFHQKQTLETIQQMLIELATLEVSLETVPFPNIPSLVSLQNIFNSLNKNSPTFAKTNNYQSLTYGIKQCLGMIKEFLKSQQGNQLECNIGRFSHFKALFGVIPLIEILSNNSLMYHDVCQMVKLIELTKWMNRQYSTQRQNQQIIIQLPFTRTRATKTITLLKNIIKHKKQNLKKQNNLATQKIIHVSPLNDTSNTHTDRLKSNAKKMNKIQTRIKPAEQNILELVLNQQNTYMNIVEFTNEINITTHKFRKDQKQKQLFGFIFGQICKVQQKFCKKQKSSPTNKMIAPKNFILSQLYPNTSPNPQHTPNCPPSAFSQIAFPNQVTMIQNIPFPCTRRSLNFSMLQLTDQLVLGYISSLEKFKDLEELCVRKNKLTKEGYRMMRNLWPGLRSLDVRGNQMTHDIVSVLTQWKQLNILYISECYIQTKDVLKICFELQHLNVLYCDHLKIVDQQFSSKKIADQQHSTNIITDERQSIKQIQNDYSGIFYIMCLNLKKLLFFSIKGIFQQRVKQCLDQAQCQVHPKQQLTTKQTQQLTILSTMCSTLKKRHGIIQL